MSDFGIQVRFERAVTTIEEHARRLSELEDAKPQVLASEVRQIRQELHDLREDVKATKRALYTVALSVAGGAITFAFTAFQLWGSGP